MAHKKGTHQPTPEQPTMFTYPDPDKCRLLNNTGISNELGCPLHPGCSCSHGLDSGICEHAIK